MIPVLIEMLAYLETADYSIREEMVSDSCASRDAGLPGDSGLQHQRGDGK